MTHAAMNRIRKARRTGDIAMFENSAIFVSSQTQQFRFGIRFLHDSRSHPARRRGCACAGATDSAEAAARQDQAASRFRDRGLRDRGAPTRGRWRSATREPFSSAAAPPRRVYAIVDRDNDNKADQVHTIATGLNIAERHRVPRRRALCGRDQSSDPLRRDRIEARVASGAGRRQRQAARPSAITAGSTSASAPTACSTFRSARRATSASGPTTSGSPRSRG